MSSREISPAEPGSLPRWLRTVLLVVTTAILCSCRGQQTASVDPFKQRSSPTMLAESGAPGGPLGAPQSTTAAAPRRPARADIPTHTDVPPHEVDDQSGVVLASAAMPIAGLRAHHPARGPAPADDCWWQVGAAPEYKLPPADEVLCDGGDDGTAVAMLRDGTLAGLDMEDAIAHYRTLEGQTVLVPTNEVCVYAPRFGAVRQVSGASISIRNRGPEGMATDLALVGTEGRFEPTTTLQRQEPAAGIADKPSSLLRGRRQGGGLENDQGISRATGSEVPLTNLQATRFVLLDNRDQPLDLGGMINAIHWTHDLGVQVVIDQRKAQVINSDKQVAFLYHVEEQNKPRLKVVKLADRTAAHPGDVIHFQLRYKNVGNRPITELTLVDNLTTRLEYVEGSQQSDRPVTFDVDQNEGGSLVLRWELQQPLEPGQEGVVQFDCRVR